MFSSQGIVTFTFSYTRWSFGSTCRLAKSENLQAFLSLESGEIKTYDLLCLQKSPYTIPNMWTLYEKKLSASGAPPDSNPSS